MRTVHWHTLEDEPPSGSLARDRTLSRLDTAQAQSRRWIRVVFHTLFRIVIILLEETSLRSILQLDLHLAALRVLDDDTTDRWLLVPAEDHELADLLR